MSIGQLLCKMSTLAFAYTRTDMHSYPYTKGGNKTGQDGGDFYECVIIFTSKPCK